VTTPQESPAPDAAAPHRRRRELQAFEHLLAELAAGFVGLGADRIDPAIDEALRRIVETLGIDRATLTQVSPLTGRIEVTHSWARDGLARVPPRLDAAAQGPWSVAMARAGRPVVFARLGDLPPEAAADRATFERIGLKSHVTMPMRVAGTLVGGLSIGTMRRARGWPAPLQARLRLLADLLAGVLARRHAEALRERALDFERLAARILAALLIAGARDEGAIVEAGLRDLAAMLGADRAGLWEAEPGGAAFRRTMFWFSAELPAAEQWTTTQLPWIAAQLAAEMPVRLPGLDALPGEAAADRAALQALGVRSLLALPVTVAGALVGSFSLAAVRQACDWPETLLPGLQLLAEVFATLHVRRGAEARKRAAEAEAALWRERLAHVMRVHTVGELSTALAHEITQPLGAIENYALAARHRAGAAVPDVAKLIELLDRIVTQASRAGDVVTRLRAMVRRHDLQLGPIDLAGVVEGCVDLLRGECEARGVAIDLHRPAAPLPPLLADEIYVQQVVLNLLRNALDAMAQAPADAPRRIEVHLGCGAAAASVQVDDHGPGIADDDLERVFEPFHTTKATGLGVGLAICRRLIEAHGGRLCAAHNPRGGASLRFTLPLTIEPAG
jgi:signal transduction histidine kinase